MLKTVPHRPSGFTLIELMVVVVLIGVVAAMVVPSLGGSAETVRLEAAARRVSDMMDFCSKTAAASGRVHALLFDQTARRFDVVCEPTPVPTAADGADGATAPPAAELPADAATPAPGAATDAAADASAESGSPAAAAGDQAAQLGLVRVSIPGFLDRTLPEGVGLSGLETYETDLATGETEGQFKLLFFPDGTTEFAQVELSIPSGQRRVVALNGIGGTVSIFDPGRHGEIDMNTLVTDEDNPVETDGTGAEVQPESAPEPEGVPGIDSGLAPGERTPGVRGPAAGGMDGGGMNPDRPPAGRPNGRQPADPMIR